MFGNDKSRKNGLNIIVVGGGKVGGLVIHYGVLMYWVEHSLVRV